MDNVLLVVGIGGILLLIAGRTYPFWISKVFRLDDRNPPPSEAFADGSGKVASDIIPQIGDTTEVILGFDEKYPLPEGEHGDYKADLSLLGEVLESRFELEDGLIAGLHKAHATLVGGKIA